MRSYFDPADLSFDHSESDARLLPKKLSPSNGDRRKQIRLAPLNALTISKPLQPELLPVVKSQLPKKFRPVPKLVFLEDVVRSEARKPGDSTVDIDVEESVWCRSDASSGDSEEELPSPRKFLLPKKPKCEQNAGNMVAAKDADIASILKDLTLSSDGKVSKPTKPLWKPEISSQSRPSSSSDKENHAAFLRFSPPRLHSPQKSRSEERPATPPQSPSKSRLQSPSKTRMKIPTPPYRQSLDAFWNADNVNDWNEQYSPKKILKSPKKLKFLQDDLQHSPTSSPRKRESPSKRTKAEIEAKKNFDSGKHLVAEDFLTELDRVITQGRVRELAVSTGGVHFLWSKTLNSTAGRANWRRETTKTRHLDGTVSTTHKHHASIELAEKVIDNEHRLLNVIAHEFCHLANFMVSGIKDQPHGRQFKEWGRKCTAAFGDRGVKVTTKHTFEIEYRYVWQCSNEDCGVEFKRHSKSIDPKRHTCGTCRSKIVQIKPVPRKDNGNGTSYAAYVKTNFAEVKKCTPGASQKEIMEAVARKYRAEKEAKSNASPDEVVNELVESKANVDNVVRNLEFITLDD